ncbi:hypothetical protein AVEN_48461-1 [Araneus ventricosus]|uniref:Uncharacterized protein n=1 Tax=Araneus ventricosus TaxID=182803 RepID=A0A4Y2X937_ARAVE|nr:hypothetical protein AVEN_48461-1 [Araneus ventricosus]
MGMQNHCFSDVSNARFSGPPTISGLRASLSACAEILTTSDQWRGGGKTMDFFTFTIDKIEAASGNGKRCVVIQGISDKFELFRRIRISQVPLHNTHLFRPSRDPYLITLLQAGSTTAATARVITTFSHVFSGSRTLLKLFPSPEIFVPHYSHETTSQKPTRSPEDLAVEFLIGSSVNYGVEF